MNERNLFRTRQPDLVLARKLTWVVWVVSAAVLGLVALMREVKIPIPDYFDLSYLPAFHAILNTFAAFFLVMRNTKAWSFATLSQTDALLCFLARWGGQHSDAWVIQNRFLKHVF